MGMSALVDMLERRLKRQEAAIAETRAQLEEARGAARSRDQAELALTPPPESAPARGRRRS